MIRGIAIGKIPNGLLLYLADNEGQNATAAELDTIEQEISRRRLRSGPGRPVHVEPDPRMAQELMALAFSFMPQPPRKPTQRPARPPEEKTA